jgi:hypothetical protein
VTVLPAYAERSTSAVCQLGPSVGSTAPDFPVIPFPWLFPFGFVFTLPQQARFVHVAPPSVEMRR